MIYKNDELHKLAPNDFKELEKKFKFPMRITYPPGRVKKSLSPHNKLPDKPNSISFPLRSTMATNTGTDVWRYADNVIIKEHGVKDFIPANFRFNGNLVLEEKDRELAWFLFTKSEFCGNGLNAGAKPKFVFEDKVSDAERKAEAEALQVQARALIFGRDIGFPEEKLRAIAKAYFVKNVDELTFAQVKIALEQAIMAEGKDGYSNFIEITNSEAYIKLRMRMQHLIDLGKMSYNAGKREWAWMDNGKKVEAICGVAPGENAKEVLVDFYNGNSKFQETMAIVEKSKKVRIKEDPKDESNEI